MAAAPSSTAWRRRRVCSASDWMSCLCWLWSGRRFRRTGRVLSSGSGSGWNLGLCCISGTLEALCRGRTGFGLRSRCLKRGPCFQIFGSSAKGFKSGDRWFQWLESWALGHSALVLRCCLISMVITLMQSLVNIKVLLINQVEVNGGIQKIFRNCLDQIFSVLPVSLFFKNLRLVEHVSLGRNVNFLWLAKLKKFGKDYGSQPGVVKSFAVFGYVCRVLIEAGGRWQAGDVLYQNHAEAFPRIQQNFALAERRLLVLSIGAQVVK